MTSKVSKFSILNGLNGILSVLIFYLYSYILGTRDFSVGSDTNNYVYFFRSIGSNLQIPIEVGFKYYIILIHSFTNDPKVFLLITALLTSTLFILAGMLIVGREKLSLYLILLAILPFYYSFITNVLRQGIAVAILLLTYGLFLTIKKYKYILAVAGIIISSLFHLPSAIIMIPLFVRLNLKKTIYIWILSVTTSIFSSHYSSYLSSFINGKYTIYLDADANYQLGFRWQFVLLSAVPFVTLIVLNRYKLDNRLITVLSGYALVSSLAILLNFLPYYDRFISTSWIMLPLIFSLTMNNLTKNKRTHANALKILAFTYTTFALFGFLKIVIN